MAVWYPSSGSPCRVDLLVASQGQIVNAIKCEQPGISNMVAAQNSYAVYQQALSLRTFGTILANVAPGVVDLTQKAASIIKNDLPVIFDNVANFLAKSGLDARSALQRDLQAQSNSSQSIFDKIVGGIGGIVTGAKNAVGDLIDKATGTVSNVINGAASTVSNLVNTAKNAVGNVISDAGDFIGGIVTTVRNTLSTVVGGAINFLTQRFSELVAGIGDFVADAGNLVGGIVTTVKQFIGDLVRNVQTGIGGIVEKLSSIPGAIFQIGEDVINAVGSAVDDVVGGLGKFLSDPVSGIIGGFFHGEEPQLLSMVDRVYDRIIDNPETPGDFRKLVIDAKTPGAPIPALVAAVVLPFVLISLLTTVGQPIASKILQWEMREVRPTLMGAGDIVQAYYRKAMSKDAAFDMLAALGFEDQISEKMLILGQQLPTPTDLIDWKFRNIINDGQMVERLQRQGWTPDDATNILDASEVIPPLGDLVRFAVREAFPGQVAFDGVRGTGVPSRFTELAKKQGLEPESARSYWAAHWELPSVSAAFSMYHRSLINESQLRQLLREQDFAPEWIDHLINVAYDPLTRVDVRRMRALGVLTPAQVEDAYRDLGYSPQNARRLRDFVEADIADSKQVETSPERDLSRADLVGAYADGILTRGQAGAHLRDLGYSGDEAELILDREDIRAMRAERKETKSAIVDQVIAGVIDLIAAQDKLSQAGYTTDEIAATVAEIGRKQAALVKQPTKAELDRFRKFKLLSDDEYRVELRRLGYSDRWVEAFVALGAAVEVDSGTN